LIVAGQKGVESKKFVARVHGDLRSRAYGDGEDEDEHDNEDD
jgi:hypothetical protein